MSTTPPDADRLIQTVLADLGWDADASAVAARVKRLDIGLPCEDEFAVVCGWLGKTRLLHKLDQQQIPISSRAEFQVPDLLALFSTQKTESPILIEVKSSVNQTLSFQPGYLDRLFKYSELLKFPLLIAWKHHSIWTLFEAKHIKKATRNFNITLGLALKENLLGSLVGDVMYTVGAGAGIHFIIRKDELRSKETKENIRTEYWNTVVEGITVTDFDGNKRVNLKGEVTALFAAWDLELQERHTISHIYKSFVAGAEGMEFAHRALVRLLEWERPENQQLNWRHHLRKNQVTASIDNFLVALEAGLQQRIIYHIFHQQPQTMPDFITPRAPREVG